ncbi:MAG: glycosyltransferase [Ginsengibacter sp.]
MSTGKNILFISYDGMTDPLGQSQVIPYLIGLTKCGFHFTILSSEKPASYDRYKDQIASQLKAYSIKWYPIPYHKKPPVISSVYDVKMLKRKARELHLKEHFDMVHTRAGVPALVGLWMKNKFGIKFMHDIREFYADSRVEGGMWNKTNFFYRLIYKFFKRKEAEELKNCDGIVCLTYVAEEIIRKSTGFKQSTPLEVIPCSVDMDLFDPGKIDAEEIAALRRDYNLTETDCVISYLGSIGGWYLTDEMMRFCKDVSDKIVNAKFLFITPCDKEIIFRIGASFEIPKEKIIVAHAERNRVPLFLSLSQFAMFFIKPCYSKQSSSPTKHGEIMAMGIPVITNSGVGDVAEIVLKYRAGVVLTNFSEEHFKMAADKIGKSISHSRSEYRPAEIRNAAREYYDLKNAVKKYERIYDAVLR